ncbi:hypothetical protein GCM10025855_41360 [Shewanella glacialipiscicola]|uniref:Zinc metalloprotease HtpX n=1 Tax=Shewanella glacialipiscicola TaxID=614069 RepID=A0ABQ6JCJ3_9GAMM|nr:hypothetical protein GCM10025855_41360 [Shewanella glacialipiscicola]
MKRIFLLIATNLAVLLVASIVMSILGVNTSTMGGLLVFAAIFGFGGAFISLAISKWMAKKPWVVKSSRLHAIVPNVG